MCIFRRIRDMWAVELCLDELREIGLGLCTKLGYSGENAICFEREQDVVTLLQ